MHDYRAFFGVFGLLLIYASTLIVQVEEWAEPAACGSISIAMVLIPAAIKVVKELGWISRMMESKRVRRFRQRYFGMVVLTVLHFLHDKVPYFVFGCLAVLLLDYGMEGMDPKKALRIVEGGISNGDLSIKGFWATLLLKLMIIGSSKSGPWGKWLAMRK